MTARQVFMLPEEATGTEVPHSIGTKPMSATCRTVLTNRIGIAPTFPLANIYAMDDDELQRHITHCGIQMQAAYKLGMKGEAHRWRKAQEMALWERSRRPQIVAQMEQERGLG